MLQDGKIPRGAPILLEEKGMGYEGGFVRREQDVSINQDVK